MVPSESTAAAIAGSAATVGATAAAVGAQAGTLDASDKEKRITFLKHVVALWIESLDELAAGFCQS